MSFHRRVRTRTPSGVCVDFLLRWWIFFVYSEISLINNYIVFAIRLLFLTCNWIYVYIILYTRVFINNNNHVTRHSKLSLRIVAVTVEKPCTKTKRTVTRLIINFGEKVYLWKLCSLIRTPTYPLQLVWSQNVKSVVGRYTYTYTFDLLRILHSGAFLLRVVWLPYTTHEFCSIHMYIQYNHVRMCVYRTYVRTLFAERWRDPL